MPFKPHPTDPNSVIYKVNKYWIPKPFVGLTVNEARDFFESKLTRAELITEISEFLEEKNNG
jgi:hypothetical protein